ncbi:MAG: hypothetical protein GF400_02980 [Candidatus Eisenbacteria bacterium]|nr:hypothetical protein [Candidatus Eisenbacteria bacterium]
MLRRPGTLVLLIVPLCLAACDSETGPDGSEDVHFAYELGVSRRIWIPSSVPTDQSEGDAVSAADRMDVDWYNPEGAVLEGDLHPELPPEQAAETRTVLKIAYASEGEESWAGVMRLLSSWSEKDFSDYDFVELWVNTGAPISESAGFLRIELGAISEDYYPLQDPNGVLDSEDVDVPPNGFDHDEDTGLDNVWGDDGAGIPGDDGDDDYFFEYGSDDYSNINGTENNDRLDTEDLNYNGYLDQDNAFWQLAIDLSDTTHLVQDNSQIVSGNDWRLYRVPLDAAVSVGGIVSWSAIESARFWVESLPVGEGALLIGSLDVVRD